MTELKRQFLIFVTAPFMLAGMMWQIIAGGFYAGRLTTTAWTAKLADDVLAARIKANGGEPPKPRPDGPRMH